MMIEQIKNALIALKILGVDKRLRDLESEQRVLIQRGSSSTGGSSTAIIPQYSSDPVSPSAQDAWVLEQGSGGSGGGIYQAVVGMGAPLLSPNTGASFSYRFSYRTQEGTTKRVTLT